MPYSSQFSNNLHQTLNTGNYQFRKTWLNFGIHPPLYPNQGLLLKDSLTLRDRTFRSNFAHICGKTNLIFSFWYTFGAEHRGALHPNFFGVQICCPRQTFYKQWDRRQTEITSPIFTLRSVIDYHNKRGSTV